MNRQQILDLYTWEQGICFRHPTKGTVRTTVAGVVHPAGEQERRVPACEDCVITMEDIRRETAARTGVRYEPGHIGEPA